MIGKQSFRGGERAVTARKNRIRLVGALLVLVLSLSLVGCAVREDRQTMGGCAS